MFHVLVLIIFIICGLISAQDIFAQTSGAQQKTQEIAESLNKTKYKHKVKKNFEFERYIDVKNEAVVKNASEYAGVYESSEASYRLELRVTGGKIEGSGYESDFKSSARVNFTLKDARIEGALLTATKVYADGNTERFEAVFVNRTVTEGANPNKIENRETRFGLGFVDVLDVDSQTRVFEGGSQVRVFCEYKN
jgi:disulfide oxidoreductase YuzD